MSPPVPSKRVHKKVESDRFLHISESIWKVALLSLPLDLFIRPTVQGPCAPQPELGQGSVICLAIAVLGVGFEPILRSLERARRANPGSFFPKFSNVQSLLQLILILLFLAKFAAPLLAFWRSPAVLLPFAVALVVLGARKYKSPSKTTGTATDTRSAMAKARQWDTESVLLCVVPMLAARAFSAQQSLQCSTSALQHAAVILLAFLLLMALRPKRNYFTGRCRRCFTLCSRSIASQFPHCPSCAPEKFHEERRDQVGATAGETPPESRV